MKASSIQIAYIIQAVFSEEHVVQISLVFFCDRTVAMINKGEGTDVMYLLSSVKYFQGLMPGDGRETRNRPMSCCRELVAQEGT